MWIQTGGSGGDMEGERMRGSRDIRVVICQALWWCPIDPNFKY